MNNYLFIPGILSFLLGVIHSVLGEYLIFKKKRIKKEIVPSKGSLELRERHLRILWSTWHLASVFGWCIAGLLIKISLIENFQEIELVNFILELISSTMFFGAILVLIGTKGKHPGWFILLLIGFLIVVSCKIM
ncbi:hypothetical protein SAMN04487765_1177 [Tenacibaculum sp. MAR_2010_89]|uniref:hypothetical protein n=1 Tax=Tenacibaculum sp. MAR_2010_89 TaxID=1250198 RepID=UPI00089A58D3|nr:hypothetical protein [Tenacibaculum sp. MAR_2010_89]SEE03583.1 hypothetical protein SAMN04487765_1177 [Tenacibaculum sp. MAR_2010_89]